MFSTTSHSMLREETLVRRENLYKYHSCRVDFWGKRPWSVVLCLCGFVDASVLAKLLHNNTLTKSTLFFCNKLQYYLSFVDIILRWLQLWR